MSQPQALVLKHRPEKRDLWEGNFARAADRIPSDCARICWRRTFLGCGWRSQLEGTQSSVWGEGRYQVDALIFAWELNTPHLIGCWLSDLIAFFASKFGLWT